MLGEFYIDHRINVSALIHIDTSIYSNVTTEYTLNTYQGST